MRLVGEGTRKALFQVKARLLLSPGGCWHARVAGENKRCFGSKRVGKKLSLHLSANEDTDRILKKRYLDFLWQSKSKAWHFWAFLHQRPVFLGCWRSHQATRGPASSPRTCGWRCHAWLLWTCKHARLLRRHVELHGDKMHPSPSGSFQVSQYYITGIFNIESKRDFHVSLLTTIIRKKPFHGKVKRGVNVYAAFTHRSKWREVSYANMYLNFFF